MAWPGHLASGCRRGYREVHRVGRPGPGPSWSIPCRMGAGSSRIRLAVEVPGEARQAGRLRRPGYDGQDELCQGAEWAPFLATGQGQRAGSGCFAPPASRSLSAARAVRGLGVVAGDARGSSQWVFCATHLRSLFRRQGRPGWLRPPRPVPGWRSGLVPRQAACPTEDPRGPRRRGQGKGDGEPVAVEGIPAGAAGGLRTMGRARSRSLPEYWAGRAG